MLVRYLRPSCLHPIKSKQIVSHTKNPVTADGVDSMILQERERDDLELIAIAVPPARQFEW
jgi:hypothetical protein